MQATPTRSTGSVWLTVFGWVFLLYLYIQILGFYQGDITNPLLGVLYFVLFGVHEAAHIVAVFLPPVVTAAAGSLSEIVFTGLMLLAALKARAFFVASFALLWVMLAFTSAGRYMADAIAQSMPLMGPGQNPQHDWNFVFTQLGWLENSVMIGDVVRIVGYGIGAIGLLLGLVLVVGAFVKRYS